MRERLINREATVRGINGRTDTEMIAIDQGLTQNSVSAHHIIELILNLIDENY